MATSYWMQNKKKGQIDFMKKAGIYLLVLLSCYGCGNNKQEKKTHAQAITEEGFVADSLCGVYKRYAGTIAGQPVVLHYMQYGTTIRCEYYYENIGQIISLYNYSDSANEGLLYFSESPATERTDEEAHWEVIMTADSISGVWKSNDDMKIHPILLKEDYSKGNQHFGIVCMADSARLKDNAAQPQASITYQMLLPVGYDEATGFTRSVIYRSIGCDTTDSPNIKMCLDALKDAYFKDYRSDTAGMIMDAEAVSFNNRTQMTNFWVTYNENGLVVLNHHRYEYTGGAHGNYASNYLCIDAQKLKLLELTDIMLVDEPRLVKLLELEARKLYHANATDSLNTFMLAEELYVPKEFYITNKGITFVYGIYEVASYAEGEINLFIPYSKIMDLLTQPFKQRMGLNTVAINHNNGH